MRNILRCQKVIWLPARFVERKVVGWKVDKVTESTAPILSSMFLQSNPGAADLALGLLDVCHGVLS